MDELIEGFATADDEESFWAKLERLLTDEVVLAEARSAGMDWPDFESGRERLRATVRALAARGVEAGWITPADAGRIEDDDPAAALEAVRPHAEGRLPFPIDPPERG